MSHGVALFTVKIVNNEDHNVTVDLMSNDGRLNVPDSVELSPGINLVGMSVSPAPVNQFVLDNLSFTATWGLASVDVNVMKFGA